MLLNASTTRLSTGGVELSSATGLARASVCTLNGVSVLGSAVKYCLQK
jgi:hypothetical protein